MRHVISRKEVGILLFTVALMFAVSYSSSFSGLSTNKVTGFVTSSSGTQIAQQTLTILPATGIKAGDTITIKSFVKLKLSSHKIGVIAYTKEGIELHYYGIIKDCNTDSKKFGDRAVGVATSYCETKFTIPKNDANLYLRIDASATTFSYYSLIPVVGEFVGGDAFHKEKIILLPPPSNDNCGRVYNDWTCDDTKENCGPSYQQGKSMESCHECQAGGFDCQNPCKIYKLDAICDDTKENCGDAYSPGVSIDACEECTFGVFNCKNPCSMYAWDDICDDTSQKCGKFYQKGVSVDKCNECGIQNYGAGQFGKFFEIATGNKCPG